MLDAREIYIGSKTYVTVHNRSKRYICGLQSAPVSLGGLRIVCCMNFYVKYFNRVIVKTNKQNKTTTTTNFVV